LGNEKRISRFFLRACYVDKNEKDYSVVNISRVSDKRLKFIQFNSASKTRGIYCIIIFDTELYFGFPIESYINIPLYGGRIVAGKFVVEDFGNVILLARKDYLKT